MFNAVLTLKDSYGRITTKRIETTATTLAGAQTIIAAYVADLAPVTDLELLKVTYSEIDTDDAFGGTGDSNVDVGATFKVLLADGSMAAHKVPGFPSSLVGGNGAIDCTQTEVAAYFENFVVGEGCRLSDGEYITGVVSGQLDR